MTETTTTVKTVPTKKLEELSSDQLNNLIRRAYKIVGERNEPTDNSGLSAEQHINNQQAMDEAPADKERERNAQTPPEKDEFKFGNTNLVAGWNANATVYVAEAPPEEKYQQLGRYEVYTVGKSGKGKLIAHSRNTIHHAKNGARNELRKRGEARKESRKPVAT